MPTYAYRDLYSGKKNITTSCNFPSCDTITFTPTSRFCLYNFPFILPFLQHSGPFLFLFLFMSPPSPPGMGVVILHPCSYIGIAYNNFIDQRQEERRKFTRGTVLATDINLEHAQDWRLPNLYMKTTAQGIEGLYTTTNTWDLSSGNF